MAAVNIFPFIIKVAMNGTRPFMTVVFAISVLEAERVAVAMFPGGKLQSRPKKVAYEDLIRGPDQRPSISTSGSSSNMGT